MNLSYSGLSQLLASNVVELRFTRRNPRSNRPPTRRMMASLCTAILDTDLGRSIFNFKPPTAAPSYSASAYNLLVVYDLFMQDWRSIPADATEVVRVLPSNPPSEFWEYFSTTISKMTVSQKATFMDQ